MRLQLFLLFWLAWAALAPAYGETVIVNQPWVQIRSAPSPNGKPIALAYGNDSYAVLGEQGQWVRIRTARKVTGWLPRESVYLVTEPIARKSLAYAIQLKAEGKERQARAKLFEIMRRFPGTIQSYEATRHLLSYHPVGELPEPKDGRAEPKARAQAERFASWLMVEEGLQLIREKRYEEAVSMFEEARARGRLNLTAMDGIREALQNDYRDAQAAGDQERAKVTMLALRSYFPEATSPETFRFKRYLMPQPKAPTMAPMAPPPPPIEEEAPPGLHEFERRELELAPETEPPASSPRTPGMAPETPNAPMSPEEKRDAAPDSRMRDLPPSPPKRATASAKDLTPAPALPQDVPPGFSPPAETDKGTPREASLQMKGLWPAGEALAGPPPPPPRTSSEWTERPPMATAPRD
jgi:hypothetical protein